MTPKRWVPLAAALSRQCFAKPLAVKALPVAPGAFPREKVLESSLLNEFKLSR